MTTPAWQPGTLYPVGSLVRRNSTPPPTAQEITNPGFEMGSLTGWTTEGSGWSATTSTKYAGTYSAKFEPNPIGVGRLIAATPAPCRPGQTINASCMVKQGAASAGNAGGRVQLTWYDSVLSVISVSDGSNVNNSDTANWRKSSLTATAPANAAYVAIGCRCFQEELGKKVHVDTFLWDHVYSDNNSAGLVFRAVVGGYSGATEPNWPTAVGIQVIDNEVTWEAVDSAYVTWEAVPILKSAATEPNWPEQVGAAVDDGTVRWVAVSRRVEDEKCPNSAAVVIAASKVFAADEDIIAFSATTNPLDWSATEDAGYLPFGLQQFGANPVEVLTMYRSNLAAFNADGYQMWQVDQDPANMAFLDAAPVGSTEPRACQPVQNDLMFLSAVGVRNLSIAGGSTNLQAGSLGEPIDPLVAAAVRDGTYTPISCVVPSYGQYWLIFGPQAFVFTSQGQGKGTWSRYTFPESVTDATLLGDDLYLRTESGAIWKLTTDEVADDVYCQGEAPVLISLDEYDTVVELAWTYDYPEFDAVTFRILRSVDGSLFAEIGSVPGDTLTYTDTTATVGHTYVYGIVARPDPAEAIDSEMSNTMSVEIPAVAPAPVLSGAIVAGTSELDWTAAGSLTGSTITGYQVWRSEGEAPSLIHTTDGVTLEYVDTTIVADVTYTYYVVAVADSEEVSPASNSVSLVYEGGSSFPAFVWINPGAELGDLTGWTATVGAPGVVARPASSGSGAKSFWGAQSALTKMHQDLVIPGGDWPTEVDAGNVRVRLNLYTGYYQMANQDVPTIRISALDAGDVELTAVTGFDSSGSLTTYPSGSSMRWRTREKAMVLPALTRKVRVELISTRLSGTNNDAGFDNVIPTLELIA